MTHQEFNRLYDNGEISVKVFQQVETVNQGDEQEKTIEAFEYNGKFFLRIHTLLRYKLDRRAECGKVYNMAKESHFIKEFDDKWYANNYFKKIAPNCVRIL